MVCPADLRREAYHLDVCSKRALSHFTMVLLFWEVLGEEYISLITLLFSSESRSFNPKQVLNLFLTGFYVSVVKERALTFALG